MSIVNRRNAVLGWLAWTAGKRVARRKAREAVPGIDADTKRPNKGAIASALAVVGGALWFWRKRRSDDEAGGDATE
jgi:hypothetical protein